MSTTALGVSSVLAGRYELVRHVARDGMSDVYEAEDQLLHRGVAVRVCRGTTATDRAQFEADVAALAALDHPGPMRVFDAGEHEGVAFAVLEGAGLSADATRTMPVADETAVMPAALAPQEEPPTWTRNRRVLFGALVGLLLLVAVLAAGSGGGLDVETPSTTAPNGSVVTSATPTSAAPTTTETTQPPEAKGKGKGHRGDG